MKAKQLDKKFDEAEDVTKPLEVSQAQRPERSAERCQPPNSTISSSAAGERGRPCARIRLGRVSGPSSGHDHSHHGIELGLAD